jgi:hypothetical protein
MDEKKRNDESVVAETKRQMRAGRTRSAKAKRGPEAEGCERSSLGSPRATEAPPRQIGDRAAASSWETDGGSGT